MSQPTLPKADPFSGIGKWDGRVSSAILESPYEDPAQQLIPFGSRSFYLSPWRSYMDTRSISNYLDGLGINFNVNTAQSNPVAALLKEAGISSARVEIGWNNCDFDQPQFLKTEAQEKYGTILSSLITHQIRPLILLNANSKAPCPTRRITTELLENAHTGAQRLKVKSTDGISPHRTGLTGQHYANAWPLITSTEEDGTLILSSPLRKDIPAGPINLLTLRFHPFPGESSVGANSEKNDSETLSGWRQYVAAVCSFAASTIHSHGLEPKFDLEIWNELSFGSEFLNASLYYESHTHSGKTTSADKINSRKIQGTLLEAAIKQIQSTNHHPEFIRIINGFSNQRPWEGGTTMESGLAGFSRHYYTGLANPQGNKYVFAAGKDPKPKSPIIDQQGNQTSFIPTFIEGCPERWHFGFQTEYLTRDIQPFPGPFKGHGRFTCGQDGHPAEVWMSETNTNRAQWTAYLSSLTNTSPSDPKFQKLLETLAAKTTLRNFLFHTHKGLKTINLYAAHAPLQGLGFFPENFLKTLSQISGNHSSHIHAGLQFEALHRMTKFMKTSSEPIANPRHLKVEKLVEHYPRLVLKGDGTSANPDLFHRHDFAVLPFQKSASHFAIAVYVATRNPAHEWDTTKEALDSKRYDMPPQDFDLTLTNICGRGATVSLYDPLLDQLSRPEILSAEESRLTVKIPAMDYPRFLEIKEPQNGPLILRPTLTTEKGRRARVTFSSNIPARAKISWGALPSRATRGQRDLGEGTYFSFSLPLRVAGEGIRIRLASNGMETCWPHWDYDVQGRF